MKNKNLKKYKVRFQVGDVYYQKTHLIVEAINLAQAKRQIEKDIKRRPQYYKRKFGFIPDIGFASFLLL